MDEKNRPDDLVSLRVAPAMWRRFFSVAPLVLAGTKEESGAYDLAPKHMVTPLGWEGHFGFVCTPRHATYWNAKREGAFTISYPRPTQVILTALAASPRDENSCKPSLEAIPTFPARVVDGVLLEDGHLFFECELDRVIDGFGDHSLIIGRIVAAHARRKALRHSDRDDQDLIFRAPLLTYLHPGRFGAVRRSFSFPFYEADRYED